MLLRSRGQKPHGALMNNGIRVSDLEDDGDLGADGELGAPSDLGGLDAQDVGAVAGARALAVEQGLRVDDPGVGVDGEEVRGPRHDRVDDRVLDRAVPVHGLDPQHLGMKIV